MKFFLGIFFGFFAIEKNRFLLACWLECESDYHLVDGICMKISDHRGSNLLKTWDEARDICYNQDAKLALITSQAQNDFITDNSEGLPVWIGIREDNVNNLWIDEDTNPRSNIPSVRVTQQFSF